MFVCSVGDEVATKDDQLKAKNDRQMLVAKYRTLKAGQMASSTSKIIISMPTFNANTCKLLIFLFDCAKNTTVYP